MVFGLTTNKEAERLKQEAILREKYAAQQRQNERDREAAERLADQEREAREKLEDQHNKQAAVEKKAHEEKLKLEREKNDIIKDANAAQMELLTESHKQQREIERENEKQRREFENKVRADDIKFREETEQKREKERAEAKAREEQKQKEASAAINEANRNMMEMKDKTHADITHLVMENQKNKDELMKENLKIMESKDAANAAKLDTLTNKYQSQVKEAQDSAKQREDALHLERKAMDDKYRKEIDNMSKMSKEERDKFTADYHKMVKEKEEELSRIQQEKEKKVDELNKNHLDDLKKAHDDIRELQETSKAELLRVHKEKEELLKENAAKIESMQNKMLEFSESKNRELLAQTTHSNLLVAIQMQGQSEVQRINRCTEELGPLAEIKSSLLDNVDESCDLWSDHDDLFRKDPLSEDLVVIKDKIIVKSRAMNRNISEMWRKTDQSRSLGDLKQLLKDALRKVETTYAIPYDRNVRREIHEQETTKDRFRELEAECTKLKEIIQELPDMVAESIESALERNTLKSIALVGNHGGAKAIAAPKEDESKKALNGGEKGEPIVDEAQ